MSKKKLGQVLWARDYISEDDLQKALDQQSTRDIPLGELLFERGLVSKHALVDALEVVTRIPYLDCSSVSAHREALRLLPRSAAERFCAFPLSFEGQKLVIVMAEPQNLYTLDELRFISVCILHATMDPIQCRGDFLPAFAVRRSQVAIHVNGLPRLVSDGGQDEGPGCIEEMLEHCFGV